MENENIDSSKVTGLIHSVETCGAVDGPGLRYVIFMQGCPLRCQYCHNPDTWDIKGKDAVVYTVDELMEDIVKYKNFMKFSGGGITLSGGEPLLQPEFALRLFEACHENGIHTALDTSGFADLETVKPVFENCDLVLLDIKSFSSETFKTVTGREISPTINMAEYLAEKKIPVWLRFVLVPGLTDNLQDIEALADFAHDLGNIERVDVLPFHKMGEYKWETLGYKYNLYNTEEPSKDMVLKAKEAFAKYGFDVH